MNFGRFQLNQLIIDEYGRPHGVLAINKPTGLTSHDVVAKVRHILGTRAVGHAGALDPFASGILIVMVGRATKLSDEIMSQGKSYLATVLLGVATDSQDPEGKITASELRIVTKPELEAALKKFDQPYEQFVPVFSSIKIGGQKLRVLARKYPDYKLVDKDGSRFMEFKDQKIELPKHIINFENIELRSFEAVDTKILELGDSYAQRLFLTMKDYDPKLLEASLIQAQIHVYCPKGTYIRQFAEDLGKELQPPIPAMLLKLERTTLGSVDLSNAVSLDWVKEVYGDTNLAK